MIKQSLFVILTMCSAIILAETTNVDLSEEAYQQQANKVIMFSATYCPNCLHAKKYLSVRNIPFMEFDIEKSAAARRYFDKLGGRGTPFMLVNNHPIQGFNPDTFQQFFQK